MELVKNTADVKSAQSPYTTTASKIAAEKAAKEGSHLRKQLSREIARKNAALKENTALRVILEKKEEEVSEANRQISALEDQIFSLEAEIKELKARKNKKEKKQEVGFDPVVDCSANS